MLVGFNSCDPAKVRVEHMVGSVSLGGEADITRRLDTEGDFLDCRGLNVDEGEHCVFRVIPQARELDVRLAIFAPGTVQVAQCTGLPDPPTEEIVLHLLGRAGIPWGGNVNGDVDDQGWPLIDIAGVVVKLAARR